MFMPPITDRLKQRAHHRNLIDERDWKVASPEFGLEAQADNSYHKVNPNVLTGNLFELLPDDIKSSVGWIESVTLVLIPNGGLNCFLGGTAIHVSINGFNIWGGNLTFAENTVLVKNSTLNLRVMNDDTSGCHVNFQIKYLTKDKYIPEDDLEAPISSDPGQKQTDLSEIFDESDG